MKQTRPKLYARRGQYQSFSAPRPARPMTTLTLGYDKRRLCIRYAHVIINHAMLINIYDVSIFSLARAHTLTCACTRTESDPKKTYGDLKGLILLLFLLFGELPIKVVFLCFSYMGLWCVLYIIYMYILYAIYIYRKTVLGGNIQRRRPTGSRLFTNNTLFRNDVWARRQIPRAISTDPL